MDVKNVHVGKVKTMEKKKKKNKLMLGERQRPQRLSW